MEQENLSTAAGRERENHKQRTLRVREYRCGAQGRTARSSGEGPVMGSERRGRAVQGRLEVNPSGEEPTDRPKQKLKSFEIRKRLVFEAWEKVRANSGAPGVDAVTINNHRAAREGNPTRILSSTTSIITTRTAPTVHSISDHPSPPTLQTSQIDTSKSLERPAVVDSSTSTEMPPDQPRHSFRHPQGCLVDGEPDEGQADGDAYRIESKMHWGTHPDRGTDRSTLLVNSRCQLVDIPPEAHDYDISGRSPLQWAIDSLHLKKDKASEIVDDPNTWHEWADEPFNLIRHLRRLVGVSVETARIVASLPPSLTASSTTDTDAGDQ